MRMIIIGTTGANGANDGGNTMNDMIRNTHKGDSLLEVKDMVVRARQGDTSAHSDLQAFLDTQASDLVQKVRDLGHQAERSWITALCGEDLAAQEILTRQLMTMEGGLASPHDSPLEALLLKRVVLTWVGLQHAEIALARHLRLPSSPHEDRLQQRVDRASRRFLAAVKTLAQLRKLGPKTAIQVNIGKLT